MSKATEGKWFGEISEVAAQLQVASTNIFSGDSSFHGKDAFYHETERTRMGIKGEKREREIKHRTFLTQMVPRCR